MGRINSIVLLSIICIWSVRVVASTEVSIAVYAEHEQYITASAPYGVSWKLIELAAQSQGLKLIPERGSWQGALSRLNAQKVALIFPAFKTPEREEWGLFTLPLIPTGSSIFTLTDNPIKHINQIDFEHQLVGVTNNSIQEKLAKKVGFQHIYATTERDQLFSMLKQKRLDYLFLATAAVNYYCMFFDQSRQSDCLLQVGDEYATKHAHALSLKTPEASLTMQKINKGLVLIKDSPAVKLLFKEYNYSQQDLLNWQSSLTQK